MWTRETFDPVCRNALEAISTGGSRDTETAYGNIGNHHKAVIFIKTLPFPSML